MASPQQPATMENLPIDILSNIFIRILAKQLAQMRCVSKSWNNLLSHSSFVKSHLHHSTYKNNHGIFLLCNNGYFFNFKPVTTYPSQSSHLELTNFIKLPVKLQKQLISRSAYSEVIGSVNGLICFTYMSLDHNHFVCIWNPSLSASVTLPSYSLPYDNYGVIEVDLQFGFDPKIDDYKVIKLTSLVRQKNSNILTFLPYFDKSLEGVKECLQVDVYSMRKGFWEVINQRFPPHITMHWPEHEVFLDGHDGHLHWLGFIDDKRKLLTIVAFDVSLETFCEIPLPDSIRDYNGNRSSKVLGVLRGKLCVISHVEIGGCEVWVMDEYQVAESWVKRYVFSQFGGEITPFGFTSRNDFLFQAFEASGDTYLALYDLIEGNSKTFKHSSRQLGRSRTKVVEYVDSLVWVAPAKSQI